MWDLFYSFRMRLVEHADQFLQKRGICVCYETRYGMKVLNRILPPPQQPSANKPAREPTELDPATLHLAYDCLKDPYTLLGTEIAQSPHYSLMQCCSEGDPCKSSYFELAKKGALDGRDCWLESGEKSMEHFRESRRQLESGNYKPIWFYVLDGKRYVSDGKHRAALAAYLGIPVCGIEIKYTAERSPTAIKLLKKMEQHPKVYSKNFEHLEKLLGLQ